MNVQCPPQVLTSPRSAISATAQPLPGLSIMFLRIQSSCRLEHVLVLCAQRRPACSTCLAVPPALFARVVSISAKRAKWGKPTAPEPWHARHGAQTAGRPGPGSCHRRSRPMCDRRRRWLPKRDHPRSGPPHIPWDRKLTVGLVLHQWVPQQAEEGPQLSRSPRGPAPFSRSFVVWPWRGGASL